MTDKESEIRWKEYFYPDTNVLINNFGIKDYEELKIKETTVSFDRLLELNDNPLDLGCGKEHLLELHKYIFGDIYPFAGKIRTVNITKSRGGILFFRDDDEIDKYLDEIFINAEEELKHCYGLSDFAELLAKIYTELIYCHPFREGNGRTIREFIREFSIEKSKNMSFIKGITYIVCTGSHISMW